MNTLFSTNEAHHTLILGVYFVVSVHNFHNGKCRKRSEKREKREQKQPCFPADNDFFVPQKSQKWQKF